MKTYSMPEDFGRKRASFWISNFRGFTHQLGPLIFYVNQGSQREKDQQSSLWCGPFGLPAIDGHKLDPANSVRLTREALALLDIPLQHAIVLPGHGWRPPEPAQIKINTDAAVAYDEGKSGAGGVARSPTALLGAW